MSSKVLGQCWDIELPANKLMVLLALADHADHAGNNVYPSMGLVAWKTGYSDRQVRRIVKELVADGLLIERAKRAGKVIHYSIDLSKGTPKKPYYPRQNVIGQNVTPDIAMSPPPMTSDVIPTYDIAVSYEPSVKPSIKPKDFVSSDTNTVSPFAHPDTADESVFTDNGKPKQAWWLVHPRVIAVGSALNIPALNASDGKLYQKIATALLDTGLLMDEFPAYVHAITQTAKREGWVVTPASLIANGRPSAYMAKKVNRLPKPEPSPEEIEALKSPIILGKRLSNEAIP